MAAPTNATNGDSTAEDDMVVTPYTVSGTIDYEKIIKRFGSSRIDEALVARIARITQKPLHHFLTRDIFFSHRYRLNDCAVSNVDIETYPWC